MGGGSSADSPVDLQQDVVQEVLQTEPRQNESPTGTRRRVLSTTSTFAASGALLPDSGPHSRSLYTRLWIRCSAGMPATSENFGRSSNGSRADQLNRSRGWSPGDGGIRSWIRARIRLWEQESMALQRGPHRNRGRCEGDRSPPFLLVEPHVPPEQPKLYVFQPRPVLLLHGWAQGGGVGPWAPEAEKQGDEQDDLGHLLLRAEVHQPQNDAGKEEHRFRSSHQNPKRGLDLTHYCAFGMEVDSCSRSSPPAANPRDIR